MKKRILWGLLAVSAFYTATAAAAAPAVIGDAAAGKQKTLLFCSGCHGVANRRYANPVYNEPKLGGQKAQYIIQALKEYQSGARNNPTMRAQAAGLSEQDMADIAAFYSGNQNK